MRPSTADQQQATRRARYFFYLLGGVFTALALLLDLVPTLARVAPDHAVKACALLAIALLSIGRFAPDRWVIRCHALLTAEADS